MDNLDIISKLNLRVASHSKESGEMMVYCPLHSDTHPSLSINIYSGKFQCFSGCIKGHSISDLVFKLTGESILEGNEINWARSFKRKLLYKKIDKTNYLPAIPILPKAINNDGEDYLIKRGFNYESIINWNLQYWEQEKAVIIPIDRKGYILRYLLGVKKYKYLPGTKVSEVLFGQPKLMLDVNNSVILTEGAFDTIWMHQLGFFNTLGILGSNLSDTQYKLLQGVCKQVYLMFDGDLAGEKTKKEIGGKLRKDFIVKECSLPKGKDPNDCNKEEILDCLDKAKRI